MGKVLVVTNRKGGCGKSFTSMSIAAGLARQGKKILCIDTDNQHSLTISMGIAEPSKLPMTIATAITSIINKEGFDPTAGIISHEEGFDLMPANNSLTGVQLSLGSMMVGREVVLRHYTEMIKPLYDLIILDTCPTMDLLTINTLAAADEALIPVAPKFLDAKGLELLLGSIAQVREYINPNLSIAGILLTMVDNRTNFSREIIAMINEAYGEKIHIFKDQIPHSVRATETSATGKSIFRHDPNGKVSAAYASLADELISRGVLGHA